MFLGLLHFPASSLAAILACSSEPGQIQPSGWNIPMKYRFWYLTFNLLDKLFLCYFVLIIIGHRLKKARWSIVYADCLSYHASFTLRKTGITLTAYTGLEKKDHPQGHSLHRNKLVPERSHLETILRRWRAFFKTDFKDLNLFVKGSLTGIDKAKIPRDRDSKTKSARDTEKIGLWASFTVLNGKNWKPRVAIRPIERVRRTRIRCRIIPFSFLRILLGLT